MQWADRIGRRIKLRDLHVLHAVVDAGSMTKAASDLAISVPVVSKAIADLEHTVGARLLERSPQGIEVTASGRALLDRSRAAFDELRQGVRDIELLADPHAGEVRLGTTAPLAASFVSTVIDRLCGRYPRVMFHLAVSETPLLARALSERDIEFLIARQYRDGPMAGGQLSFEALYDDPFVVAAGIHHPLARRRALRLADLTAESWTLPPPDSPPGRFTLEAFRANGLDLPHAKVVTFPYAVRISLLATGRFLTVLPKSVLRFPGKHPFIKELPAKLPIASGPIGIAVLKGRRLSPTARLFVDCAREIAMPVAKIK